MTGVEPASLTTLEPKSNACANFATSAYLVLKAGLEPARYFYQRIFLLLYVTIAPIIY